MKTPKQDEVWYKRQSVWHHNGLRGSVIMTIKIMQRVIDSPTTSPEARITAATTITELEKLRKQLETRIDKQ